MKFNMHLKSLIALFLITALFASCDRDTDELQDTSDTSLVSQFTGEEDDESDSLDVECIALVYPVTIILPDNSENTVNNDDEIETLIDTWFDNNPDNYEDPQLVFPIEVILEGATNETVESEDELEELFEMCYGDDDDRCDDDHEDENEEGEECFEIVYPLTVVFPDGTEVQANSEMELDQLADDFEQNNPDADEYPDIKFPVNVVMNDGSELTLESYEDYDDLEESCE